MSRPPKTPEDVALIEARREGLTFRLLGARFSLTPKTAWNRLSRFGALNPMPRCSLCDVKQERIDELAGELERVRGAYYLLEHAMELMLNVDSR